MLEALDVRSGGFILVHAFENFVIEVVELYANEALALGVGARKLVDRV